MVPAGEATEKCIQTLAEQFSAGDTIIDGGNSFYQDDIRRSQMLLEKGIHFADAGTSGGVWGVDRGYCLMIGAEVSTFKHCEAIFKTLAPGIGDIPRTPHLQPGSTAELGYLHCGPVGAGHFVKMVHNGVEYGLMQAYAEGFDIFKNVAQADIPAERRYELNIGEIAELWRRGSVVGSWLLDLSAMALAESPELTEYSGYVQDSGEGRWTVNAAVEEGVPADVLTAALFARFRSRQEHTFAEKMLSAMRYKFGGHIELKSGD
jgi:6-phosphogluconate dehydrogenase